MTPPSPVDPTELAADVERAAGRIYPAVRRTPAVASAWLSALTGGDVYLKLENLQHTGSFKLRGALNKLLLLPDPGRGCVAASTGNHGAAVAWALARLGRPGRVFVPENAAPSKLEAIRRLGIEPTPCGRDGAATEQYARAYAEVHGSAFVSPYNDPAVIAGQGTVGLELEEELGALDALFVSVGGGGLIAGIAARLKRRGAGPHIVGCLPERSPAMLRCLEAGAIREVECGTTLSDATAGNLEPGAITLDLCRVLVDEWVLVSEAEIVAALRELIEIEHLLVEGAAGVAVAGLLREPQRWRDRRVAVLICGGNIGLAMLREVVCGAAR